MALRLLRQLAGLESENTTSKKQKSLDKVLEIRWSLVEQQLVNHFKLEKNKENDSKCLFDSDSNIDERTIEMSIFEKYLKTGLDLINLLKDEWSKAKEGDITTELIGIQDMKALYIIVEYLIFFGIYKESIPFGENFKKIRMNYDWKDEKNVQFTSSYLNDVTESLLNLFLLNRKNAKLLLEKYFMDILVGLFSRLVIAESKQELVKSKIESLIFNSIPTKLSFSALNQLLSVSEHSQPIVSKTIIQILSSLSVKKELVNTIISYYFLLGGEDQAVEHFDKKLALVSRLILSVPSTAESPEMYFKHIARQLCNLFKHIYKYHPITQAVLSYLAIQFMKRSNRIFCSDFLRSFFKPFFYFYSSETHKRTKAEEEFLEKDLDNNIIVVTEDQITNGLVALESLLNVKDANHELIPLLTPVIPCVYYMYQFAHQYQLLESISCLEILCKFLKESPNTDTQLVFDGILELNLPSRQFKVGSSRRMMMVDLWGMNKLNLDALTIFFDQLKQSSITGRFFLHLLTVYFRSSHQEEYTLQEAHTDEDLMQTRSISLLLLQLILAFMETYQQEIINEPLLILSFGRTILHEMNRRNGSRYHQPSHSVPTQNKDKQRSSGKNSFTNLKSQINEYVDEPQPDEFMFILLSLLKTVLQQHDLEMQSSMLPILADIIQELHVWQKSSSTKSSSMKEMVEDIFVYARLKEQILKSSLSSSENHTENDSDDINTKAKQMFSKDLNSAILDLSDEEIAMKAYGINRLRTMVMNRELFFEQSGILDDILIRILDQLDHEDSFVYLHAIKALSALTDCYPVRSLSKIVNLYTNQHHSVDYRLRLGEVMMQTVQRTGLAFDKYAKDILPGVLKVLHDENAHLRSSAISLLSIVIETSPYSILNFIHQLCDYMHHLLSFEEEIEVKRGVIYLMVQIIRQFGQRILEGKETLTTDSNSGKRQLSGLPVETWKVMADDLGYVYAMDQDELCKGHAKQGIEDLNILRLEGLFL